MEAESRAAGGRPDEVVPGPQKLLKREDGVNECLDLSVARKLRDQVEQIVFAEPSEWDAEERLSLLTFAARARSAALFLELTLGALQTLRDILVDQGYPTLVVSRIPEPWVRLENHPAEIVEAFIAARERPDEKSEHQPGLWVFRELSLRKAVKNGHFESPGNILGYPSCCVAARRRELKMMSEGYLDGLVRAVGLDPRAVYRAVVEDVKVEINNPELERCLVGHQVGGRSFPFLTHNACRDCLASDDSPSGELNELYRSIALEVSPDLYDILANRDQRVT